MASKNPSRKRWPAVTYRRLNALYGNDCFYCGLPLERAGVTLDHVVPLALGGEDEEHNLVPTCMFCNSLKGAHPANEFCGQPVEYVEGRWGLGEPYGVLTYAEETMLKDAALMLQFAWSNDVPLHEVARAMEAA